MVPLELKIQNWLLQGLSAQTIAQQLQETHKEWTQRDALVGFQFLYQTGQYKKTAKLLADRLQDRDWIPWGIALRLLDKAFSEFQPEWLLAIDKGVKRQHAQDQTWGYRHHDFEFDFWTKHRAHFKNALDEQVLGYKQKLLEQIEYFQSQRLLDHEEKALKKLMTVDPHNPDLAKQWQDFRERWASSILQKKREHTIKDESAPVDPKTEKWLQILLKDIQILIKQDNSALLDFALLFMNMEEWEKALQLFDKKQIPWTRDLRGEVYFKAQRFLELVEWCNKQEEIHADDVDTLVAIYYLRANALQALGETEQALDILKNIQALRPNYRSVDSLIFHWAKGQKP